MMNSLIKISEARRALAEAKSFDDILKVRNMASAAVIYAKVAKKGLEAQNEAAEIKIRAERKAGEILAQSIKHGGDRKSSSHNENLIRLEDIGVEHNQSHRWQKVADIPEDDFEGFIAKKRESDNDELTTAGILHFANTGAHVSYNSGENEWYTPSQYIESARSVMGDIDVDPTSSQIANEKIRAKKYYTIANDGLTKEWLGRVWMNPPYAQPYIARFCDKLLEEIENGNCREAIVLVNNATDTKWFQDVATKCTAICLVRGRIKFWAPDKDIATPLQGQAILYFGDNRTKFKKEFRQYGTIFPEWYH